MHGWILDVWEYFESDKEGLEGRLTPTVLPGWWYTRALAIKIREDTTGLQASDFVHPLTNQFTPLGILGPYIKYPGIYGGSIAFSFASPAAREKSGYIAAHGGSVQTRVPIAC